MMNAPPNKAIFLTCLVGISLFLWSFTSRSTFQSRCFQPASQTDSLDQVDDLAGYQQLKNDFKEVYYKHLRALQIHFSCSGCTGSYLELILTIGQNGTVEKYTITGERFCENKKGEKLRANLLLFISHYIYSADLNGKTFVIRTGMSLKC